MNTSEIMNLALEMIGEEEIPADSAIYYPGSNIKRVLMGIDMGVAELVVAKEMGYDAVIAHHPQGAMSTFPEILDVHIEQMVEAGVPEDEAGTALQSLKEKYELQAHTANVDHVTSFAKLLDMPFLNIHYPLDQLGRIRMNRVIEENISPDDTVGDIIKAFETNIPEFREARTEIKVRFGSRDSKAGKVVVSHGAGTNGGFEVVKAYFNNGVNTLICIHLRYGAFQKLKEYEGSGSLVVTGHIVSDLIGINPFIDKLEEEGLIVDRVSGL